MSARKANTPTLAREQIVSAAIMIVDRDGLSALSMRKLAAELGVGTMTLYHHVPDKSQLYDLILDRLMAEVDLSVDDPSAPVEERVAGVARGLRRAMLAHPHATTIAMSRSLGTAAQLRPVEKLLGIMAEAGVPGPDAMRAVNVIGQYTMGVTAAHANHLTDSEYHDASHEGDFSGITPEEFPNIIRMLGEPDQVGDWDVDFEAGLSALIRGLVTERIA